MPMNFSAQRAWSRISAQIVTGLNAVASEAAELARAKAPVRRVFRAPRRSPLHAFGPHRELVRSGRLKVALPLTSRGKFELRSGRADFINPDGSRTLGGTLRGEIHVEPAQGSGPVWIARVVSPTRYARYQELGTRHNRAHPYMRPALAQVRESFRSRMAAAAQLSGRAA